MCGSGYVKQSRHKQKGNQQAEGVPLPIDGGHGRAVCVAQLDPRNRRTRHRRFRRQLRDLCAVSHHMESSLFDLDAVLQWSEMQRMDDCETEDQHEEEAIGSSDDLSASDIMLANAGDLSDLLVPSVRLTSPRSK